MMNGGLIPKLPRAPGRADDCDAGECLRQAIRSEDYDAAGQLIAQLGETLASRLNEGSHAQKTKRLFADAKDSLQQARRIVLANRAHLQSRLNQMSRAARYRLPAGDRTSRTWLMKG